MAAKRVFLVEDEMLVALLAEDLLTELGYVVLEVAGSLSAGLKTAETTQADLAVLDVNLGGQTSAAIADVLVQRSIPFIFVTGYGAAGIPSQHRDKTVLSKPYDLAGMRAALTAVN